MMGRNTYTMLFDRAFLRDLDSVTDSLLTVRQIPKAPRATSSAVPDVMRRARPEWVRVK